MNQEPGREPCAEERIETFDDQQLMTLLSSVHVQGGTTDEDIDRFMDWAHHVHWKNIVLGLVLEGSVGIIGFKGEEPRFAAMSQILAAEAAGEILELWDGSSHRS
jgi:hypothetical protein